MINTRYLVSAAVSVALVSLSGCTTINPTKKTALDHVVANKIDTIETSPKVSIAKTNPASRVVIDNKVRIPLSPRKVDESAWLSAKKVSIKVSNRVVPLTEIIKSLSAQGLNITSDLALDNFKYAGYSLTDTSADAALKAVLGSAGLDYVADSKTHVVTIKPMATRTWYLNIGNRKSNYTTTGLASSGQGSSSGSSGSGSGSGSGSSQNNVISSVSTNVTAGVKAEDDFWTSLKAELTARLTVLRPTIDNSNRNIGAQGATGATAVPSTTATLNLPPALPADQVADPSAIALPSISQTTATPIMTPQTVLKDTKIGTFSINAETGAVSVQAPHWILGDLDSYFARVQSMYNTDIVFEGELLVLNTTSDKSEGLDITNFGSFAKGRYGMQVRNNSLGGITVTPNSAAASAVNAQSVSGYATDGTSVFSSVGEISSKSAISSTVLGITSVMDGLQVFNAYLTNLGKVTTLQKPVLTTTSGIPADFKKTTTKSYNTVSQQASSGSTGSAVVGTQNNLIEREFGTILRVNPRIDVATGLIRAHIELTQSNQIGTQVVNQSLSSSTGGLSQIPTEVPIVSQLVYSGEALLKDGDVIILGGQAEQAESTSKDGVTGLMDTPVSGAVSKANESKQKNVFYFALKVNVNKRK